MYFYYKSNNTQSLKSFKCDRNLLVLQHVMCRFSNLDTYRILIQTKLGCFRIIMISSYNIVTIRKIIKTYIIRCTERHRTSMGMV